MRVGIIASLSGRLELIAVALIMLPWMPIGDPAGCGEASRAPAPINPYKGLQDREEIFEFTEKPRVEKQGDKWIISFASKGKCDATVSILNKNGRVIRHLASGVLGINAPYPFQQNSLSQKIEWDGLMDDFSKAEVAGCKVRVSLGLKAEFDRNIIWDPYAMPAGITPSGGKKGEPGYLLAEGKDGVRYVGARSGWCFGRAYDKDGKYLYTFFPPSASKLEESFKSLSHPFAATIWGDKVLLIQPGSGFTCGFAQVHQKDGEKTKSVKELYGDGELLNLVTVMKLQPGAGEIKAVPASSVGLPPHKPVAGTVSQKDPRGASAASWFSNYPRMVTDRSQDELYMTGPGGLSRVNGKTGERDLSWFPQGLGAGWVGSAAGEVSVGFDGLIYLRTGPFHYGHWICRLSRDGKPVPFKENAVDVAVANKEWQAKYKQSLGAPLLPGITAIHVGMPPTQCQGMSWGFYAAPNGNVVAVTIVNPGGISGEWMEKNGLVNPDGKLPSQGGHIVPVWDRNGRLLSPNAIFYTSANGQGVAMDRDGNIYRHETWVIPPGDNGRHAGLSDSAPMLRSISCLVKYRGRGGAFPLGTGPGDRQKKNDKWNPNPWVLPEPEGIADSIELKPVSHGERIGTPVKCLGALWAYPGMWTEPGCTCTHLRWDLDFHARLWLPSPHLFSVVALDSNGNRIARIGRYGNADDADPKCGKIHMAWPATVAVSEEALYIMDNGDLRVIRCKLSYAAEETVPLP
ncbi:MAG: hypothetical protein N3A38_01195 [Planctomycetota bacterium]|nr:hypothetical protein [Planctomycetota bacterium]